MRKLLGILLTLILLVPLCAPAFAEETEEEREAGIVLSSGIEIDRGKAAEIMDSLGFEEEAKDMVDSVLAILGAAGCELTVFEDGAVCRLFLNGTELLSFTGGKTSQGFTILSSLFPDHALVISNFILHSGMAIHKLFSNLLNLQNAAKGTKKEKAARASLPSAGEFVDALNHCIRAEEPEKGSYDCGTAGSYDTRTVIRIDTRALVDALNDKLAELSDNKDLLAFLRKASITVEELSHLSILSKLLPSADIAVYTNTDQSGGRTGDDAYCSIEVTLPKKNGPFLSVDLQRREDSVEAVLNLSGGKEDEGIQVSAEYVPYDEASHTGSCSVAVNLMGNYFCNEFTIVPDEDGAVLVAADDLYVLDAETPLAEADIVIRPADGEAPDLDTEGKTKISFESLLREGRSKKIEELVKSIRQNVQEMIETAQEAASAA